MAGDYVEQRDGGYWIKSSRVSLDSIVYAFLAGQTAESIAQSFPVLSLREVYGAITFYLENRDQVDNYLAEARADFEAARKASREADPAFYLKWADVRRRARAVQ
jgi:uncharacterized protein (DUF433 family)